MNINKKKKKKELQCMRLCRAQPYTNPRDDRTQIRPHTPPGRYHDRKCKTLKKTKIGLCLKLLPNDTKPRSRYMEVSAGICGSGKSRQIPAVRSGSLQVDLYLPRLWAASRIKDFIWPDCESEVRSAAGRAASEH